MKKHGTAFHDTDVLIVGAGPAGSATALSLLNYSHTQVTLVEQTDLCQLRVGEQVSANFFQFLDYLKISGEDFSRNHCMPCYSSISFWGSERATTRNAIFTTEEASYQLDREIFDLTLVEKVAREGGIVLPRTKVLAVHHRDTGHWELDLMHEDQGLIKVRTQYLVDATGRNASICRALHAKTEKHDKLMGLGGFFFSQSASSSSAIVHPRSERHGQIIESCEYGWWYAAHLPHNKWVVTLFSDADIISRKRLNLRQNWLSCIKRTQHLPRVLEGARFQTDQLWVRNARSQIAGESPHTDFVAVGDAICAFDPISSMGIGFALSSACQAAATIVARLWQEKTGDFSSYQRDIRRIFNNYLSTRAQLYQKEQRWRDADFWQRRSILKKRESIF